MHILHSNNLSISVIITNYNGVNFLNKCISSILDSNYDNFEVLLIDDNSTDGSVNFVKDKFGYNEKVKIIQNTENFGPAISRNIGINNSRFDYIVFLDNDTYVDKNWLEELSMVFLKDSRIGVAQSKLILADSLLLDSCGHYLSIFGFPYEIGVKKPDNSRFNEKREIFGARSAAMMVRKDAVKDVGLFDEDYFIYGEETDLCWRLWLSGYRVVFVPGSRVYHYGGGTLSDQTRYRVFYEGAKNNTKNIIKNAGFSSLIWMLPLHISCWLVLVVISLVKIHIQDATSILKGIFWNISNFQKVYRDRIIVQCNIRRVPDYNFKAIMFGHLNFASVINKGLHWLLKV